MAEQGVGGGDGDGGDSGDGGGGAAIICDRVTSIAHCKLSSTSRRAIGSSNMRSKGVPG